MHQFTFFKKRNKVMHRSEALTRYTQNCKDFSKKAGENIVTQIKKTVEKIVAVVKKVVVCMEGNCVFNSVVCNMRGLLD